jgi:hypothetical protein
VGGDHAGVEANPVIKKTEIRTRVQSRKMELEFRDKCALNSMQYSNFEKGELRAQRFWGTFERNMSSAHEESLHLMNHCSDRSPIQTTENGKMKSLGSIGDFKSEK